MKPIKRVEILINFLNLNVSSFEKAIGASNNSIGTAIRRTTSIKDETLNNILNAFPKIDATWLLTGEGEMLKDSIKTSLDDFNNAEILKYIVEHQDEFKKMKSFPLLLKDIKEEDAFEQMQDRIKNLEKEVSLIRNSS